MPSIPEWLKEPRLLLVISAVLNVALVAVIARDGNMSIKTPWFTIARVGLNDHVEALFATPADLPQVRALLEERKFYQISPANARAEPIEQALTELANSDFANSLVTRLRDMSRDARGPFKGSEQQAQVIAKHDEDGVAEGVARVCAESGFEDLYLTIWAKDGRGDVVTVHAASERECRRSARDVIELHAQDWNKLYGGSNGPQTESVLVRLHPPRITLPSAHSHVALASPLPRTE